LEHEKTRDGGNGSENVWPPRAPRPLARAIAMLTVVIVAPLACSPSMQQQIAGKMPAGHEGGTPATQPATQPATRPAADDGKTIMQVSSLAQLRALAPAFRKNDWELRLAWAESGIEGAPWKLLYAHWKYVGGNRRQPTTLPEWGYYTGEYTLGKIGWGLHYMPPGVKTRKLRELVSRTMGSELKLFSQSTERVYCAAVQTPLAGTYEITAGAKDDASVSLVIKDPPQLGWFALFDRPARGAKKQLVADKPAPMMAMDAFLAAPVYTEEPVFRRGDGKEYPDETELFSKSLPGQCPGMMGWRSSEGFSDLFLKGEPQTPYRMDAAIADGKLVISCYKFAPIQLMQQFLVRWRINGKVATAQRLPDPVTQRKAIEKEKDRMMVEGVTTIRTAFVLPRWLATRVKAGDEVLMELLYTPQGWQQLSNPDEHRLLIDKSFGESMGRCTQPVLAKPATFRVTREMLDQSRRS
jgi:hypothetical protein